MLHEKMDPAEIRHRIAITHELDRIRSIPNTLSVTANSSRLLGKAEIEAEKTHRRAEVEELEWMIKLAGDPGFKLRTPVEKALIALDKSP